MIFRKNKYGGYVRTPAATKPSIFSWQTTSLPMDTTTTMDKVEMMRTAGNIRATTSATSTTTKMSTFISKLTTTRTIVVDSGMNEILGANKDTKSEKDETINQSTASSPKLSKMKKELNVQKDLKNEKSNKISGKKSIQNKRRILLDPAYLTGCTDKGRIDQFCRNILGNLIQNVTLQKTKLLIISFAGIYPVPEEANEKCTKRFMVCSKGKYGFRGNKFRCPRGFAFDG